MNMKTGIMMVLLGFGAGIFGGYLIMQLTHKSVKAEQFTLVDRKGRVHAILGLTNLGSPSLGIWDEEGKNRVIIGFIGKDTAGVGLNDANGTRRANIQVDPRGKTELVFFNESGGAVWRAPEAP